MSVQVKPTPKVAAGMAGGGLGVVIVAAAQELGINLGGPAMGALLSALLSSIFAFVKRETYRPGA